MIKIYATAVKQDYVKDSTKEIYIKDSWILGFLTIYNIVQQAIENGQISVNILNSLTSVYANSLMPDHISGLVLPLYDKLNIKRDVYTYQFIIEMFFKLKDLGI
jgi:hypothetical protein